MNLVIVSHAQGRIPVTVLQLQDRINLGNTAELEQAAREAITAGACDMLIDLSKVPSLTSAGIRALLVIHKMLAVAGMDKARHLKLVSPTPYVSEVLKVAGLMDYVEVFAGLDEAVASF
jgi:anti-anti-sigma factor